MKLAYPLKLGNTLFEKYTELKGATVEDVKSIFPNIKENAESNLIAVWFPGIEHPTIIHKHQVLP